MAGIPVTTAQSPPLLVRDPMIRVGLLALATDLTIEGDAARILPPDQVQLHTTRVAFHNPTTPDNLRAMLPHLAGAADLLVPDQPLAAICFGCTSASTVIGEDAIAEAIGSVRPGVPVVTPALAARRAFAALGVRRIALLTPYLPETTVPMTGYFSDNGIGVMAAHCMGLPDDRDMARIDRAAIIEAALGADHPQAEAMFLSCTALPALGVLQEIEARIGKPVVSSNQALFWAVLQIAGLAPARRIGRLFDSVGARVAS